jgi:hypothetical protein
MPDYQFNTNLGPALQQGTSLGDMLNTARGAQAFQQAEQLNPLALQKAQMEIQQAQKMNPLAVQKATAETSTAETGAKKSQLNFTQDQAKIINENIGSVLNDERLINSDPNRRASPLLEARQKAIQAGVDPVMAEVMFAPFIDKAFRDKNPNAVKDMLSGIGNTIQSGIGATGQQALQTPQMATVGGAPATFQSGTGVAKPLTIGGEGNTGLAQPPASGGPAEVGKPTGVTQTQMGLSYPVRKAGDIRPLAPNEAADTERGAKYRNDLTTRQTDLSKSRRNLDEVITAAGKIDKEDLFTSGIPGAITRSIKGALGDEKYKQLSKDLANVQISNLAAMGGSMETDAGKQLVRMANGDETYPPDILINIARRTYSDLTNLDMQATGASKFAKKYGDSNLNTFKQLWSSNADSKVFEAMAVFENVTDPAKRKAEIDKLLGNNPEQRQQFFQKYNNIKKLTATGEL